MDQQTIDRLIACKKQITKYPSDWKLDRGHYRIDFELQTCEDNKHAFTAFGRYNAAFNENFSIGLRYTPKLERGSIELLRCNGPHGEHRDYPHHTCFHIHRVKEQNLQMGLKANTTIEITDGYADVHEALRFFVRLINVAHEDIAKLSPFKQPGLFDEQS